MKATGTKPTEAPSIAADLEERIRCRAYQIFEERGRIEGRQLDDWLQAEREIMTHRVLRKTS